MTATSLARMYVQLHVTAKSLIGAPKKGIFLID
jgi:hypothetical protein